MTSIESYFPGFLARKKAYNLNLVQEDFSLKGDIDEEARPVLDLLNSSPYYLSTSSCSGRIVVWEDPNQGLCSKNTTTKYKESDDSSSSLLKDVKGHGSKACDTGGRWLYVTHDVLMSEDWRGRVEAHFRTMSFMDDNGAEKNDTTANNSCSTLYLKVEPFILHIEASNAFHGQELLKVALESGYRNSGLVLSKKRCIVAIRSTLRLDVPIAVIQDDHLIWIVSQAYLRFIKGKAEEKMRANNQQRQRLYNTINSKISQLKSPRTALN